MLRFIIATQGVIALSGESQSFTLWLRERQQDLEQSQCCKMLEWTSAKTPKWIKLCLKCELMHPACKFLVRSIQRNITVSMWPTDTKCDLYSRALSSSQLHVVTSHSAWTHCAMNCSVQIGEWSTQRAVRQLHPQCVQRFDPSHNPVQYPDLRAVSFCCARSIVARCLTLDVWTIVPQTSFHVFSCQDTTKSSPCLNTDMSDALDGYRQGENVSVENSIAVMVFSLATSKHCAASFVPYMAVS